MEHRRSRTGDHRQGLLGCVVVEDGNHWDPLRPGAATRYTGATPSGASIALPLRREGREAWRRRRVAAAAPRAGHRA
jgi:hypothetical protein